MTRYRNLTGESGIYGYEIGSDNIAVRFEDGSEYLYDYNFTGIQAIEIMKGLAKKGIGLTTFINQKVRNRFARKIK